MTSSQPRLTVNRDLLLPYFAPYAAYVIIATFGEDLNRELDYALRIVGMGGLLWFFRKQYKGVIGPKSPIGSIVFGAAVGVVAVFVWAGLVLPFHDAATGDVYGARAFALRLAAATLIVPFAEELLCRGYILGLFTQWQQEKRSGKASFGDVIDSRSIHELPPGAWSLLGVIVSAVAFAVGSEALNLPLLLVFVTGLHGLVGRRGGAGADWSRLAVAAGATLAAVFAIYAVLWDGVVLSASGLAEPSPLFKLVWQLHAGAFALALSALGTTFIGAALAAHASRLAAPWQRVLGVAGGGLLIAAGVANLAIADGSPILFVGVLGYAAWLVWLLVTGVRLALMPRKVGAASL
jgi:hypothetical protein